MLSPWPVAPPAPGRWADARAANRCGLPRQRRRRGLPRANRDRRRRDRRGGTPDAGDRDLDPGPHLHPPVLRTQRRLPDAASGVGAAGVDSSVGVFSGGSLLFGATGRPDLLGEEHTDALGTQAARFGTQAGGPAPRWCATTARSRRPPRRRVPLHPHQGRHNIPIHELPGRVAEAPAGEVWVHCASGYRASIAASLIDASGRTPVTVDDSFENAEKVGLHLVGPDDGAHGRGRPAGWAANRRPALRPAADPSRLRQPGAHERPVSGIAGRRLMQASQEHPDASQEVLLSGPR
jgi:rhodanese-related sulfurtransferase